MEERIRCKPLRAKITDPTTAAGFIQNGTNLFISGFTAGYPKLIPQELVRRADGGERFKINLFAGASTAASVDGSLAAAGLIQWRRPYMSDRTMRRMINAEQILYKDDHLSALSQQVRAGNWGPVDVTVVEAVAISEKGQLVPTMSVGNTPTYVKAADKIIVEISTDPAELEGIHDIFIPEDPPYRMPIPIYRTADRIGKPFIEMNPDKVVAILLSPETERGAVFRDPDKISRDIAARILDFVEHEIRKNRLPAGLPWQSGVGDVANAVLSGFIGNDFFLNLDIYSEVLQDSVLELIDIGKVRAASGSSLTLSQKARSRFFDELYRYREKVILRPAEISNAPEVIRRLGVIAINTAIEVDIYAQVNSTHVMGSQIMNGIGGSGDFMRNAALSFVVTPSTAKGGVISAIVPMVSHVDHSEHSVGVVVTEHGLVDTRPLTPRQTAEQIINKCAHPDYREQLREYYQRAVRMAGGHEPHLLKEAFYLHQRYLDNGDMRVG
ncbi:MAG: acetyl-CoA hydrolase [Deltaproteobacteria bacterium SG8_13]|nr:MAG: acetyl-CoA hydrolase [Deltaproteobacteria bacterium SG8_13]